MIRYYFGLQYKTVNRRWKEYGLHPLAGWALLFSVFVGLSLLFFAQISFAQYLYPFLPLYFSFRLMEADRNDFLKTCFGNKKSRTIRIAENTLVALPFIAFLLYKQCFTIAPAPALFAVASASITVQTRLLAVIPTPFGRKPFEFTIGFRNAFYIFALAYVLTCGAVLADNCNVGVFALFIIMLAICSFYLKPENPYYVWQFSLPPARFLCGKIKTAAVYSLMSYAPIILSLSFFFIENAPILLLCLLLGLTFPILFILVKYAVFPREAGVGEAVVIILCFSFPPLLALMIPYYFNRSLKRLQSILS
jgi:hypothetical protein